MSEPMRQVDLLRAACCLAGADGETSDSEKEILQRLARAAGVGTASLAAMIACAESDEQFYKNQFRIAVADPGETLRLLFRIAIVDGRLRKEEAVMLKRLSLRMGVEPERFDSWLREAVGRVRKKSAKKTD